MAHHGKCILKASHTSLQTFCMLPKSSEDKQSISGKHQWKGFALEGAIDLNHTGIVRCIAHSKQQPWLQIFPFFNGGTLVDSMETVPCPHGTFTSLVALQEWKGKILPSFKWVQPSKEKLNHAKSICAHAPSLIHALVKALRFSHEEGIIHNDLHPWNIILDFTTDLTPRIKIIDWGGWL